MNFQTLSAQFPPIKEAYRKGTVVVPSLTPEQKSLLTVTPEKSDLVLGQAESYSLFWKNQYQDYQLPYFVLKDKIKKVYDTALKFQRPPVNPKLRNKYRSGQKEAVEEMAQALKRDRGAILNAPPATGKTYMAIALAIKLNLFPMVVLVHRSDLALQWKQRFEEHTTGLRLQLWDHKHPSPRGSDVLIATGQYISRHEEAPFNFKLLVVDEAHRFTAPMFLKSINKVRFQNSLATTATTKRRDGLAWIYNAYLGEEIIQVSSETLEAKVTFFHENYTGADDWEEAFINRLCFHPDVKKEKRFKIQSKWKCLSCPFNPDHDRGCPYARHMKKETIDYMGMIKLLGESEKYRKKIEYITDILYLSGREIIFFTKFVAEAKYYHECFKRKGYDVGLYVRSQKIEKVKNCRLIITTYSKTDSGLDKKTLDAIIFQGPIGKGNFLQLLGRIERTSEGKPLPEAYYFADTGNKYLRNMAIGCENLTRSSGRQIERIV